MPTATSSSHGENRMCTAKLRTIRATMTARTRAMNTNMVIGLHSGHRCCADVSRLPPPAAAVDRDQPRLAPELHPGRIRVNPGRRPQPQASAAEPFRGDAALDAQVVSDCL